MDHITLTCQNHPNLRWSCKADATRSGRYVGGRNLFFLGTKAATMFPDAPECDCHVSDLRTLDAYHAESAPEDRTDEGFDVPHFPR